MTARRALQLRPVNSIKHVIDASGLTTLGLPSIVDLVRAVDDPSPDANEVHYGSKVSAIFISVQVTGVVAYAGVPRVYMMLFKNPGANLVIPAADAVGASNNRKWVFHQEMTMVVAQTDTSFPRQFFKGVIVLPTKYQRQGIDDKVQFVIQNPSGESTGTSRWCVQCIYKEFF